MNLADMAKNNAISLEVKKDGLAQRQSGDWTLRLTIAAADMDQRLTSANIGARFALVLVEINDDETPVDHRSKERDQWRSLGAAKQAGIRCKEPIFWAYLTEQMFGNALAVTTEETAANVVREHCGIDSRADLDKPGFSEHRTRWHELDNAYQAWKVREHA